MLKRLKNFYDFKALIRKRPIYKILLIWHKLRRTNVIEINHRAKVANKTANINVQNRSLYAIVNGAITHQKRKYKNVILLSSRAYIDT